MGLASSSPGRRQSDCGTPLLHFVDQLSRFWL